MFWHYLVQVAIPNRTLCVVSTFVHYLLYFSSLSIVLGICTAFFDVVFSFDRPRQCSSLFSMLCYKPRLKLGVFMALSSKMFLLVHALTSVGYLHLLRVILNVDMRYDWDRDVRVKINSRFEFPCDLDLSSYLEEDPKVSDQERTSNAVGTERSKTYSLFGVVVHSGSAGGGHYKTYCRELRREGQWARPAGTGENNNYDALSKGQSEIDANDPISVIKAILATAPSRRTSMSQLLKKIKAVSSTPVVVLSAQIQILEQLFSGQSFCTIHEKFD